MLRVNVHRPPGDDRVPVILFAHPYGKDDLPAFTASGRPKLSFRYRIMRQTGPWSSPRSPPGRGPIRCGGWGRDTRW
ncbi:hypothetical protein [Streptomyces sp. B6(2022)]|uniref:hypothetical protein n=1 Tax=Streptomyces sp. B6(2022) TaxID=3404749 RepID=UPI003AF0A8A8